MRPRLSFIIVTWNGWTLLEKMLESLYADAAGAGETIEVVVVDNGSTDDTIARLGSTFPDVKQVALAENVGFARSNNIGVMHASAELLVLLNNDVIVPPGFVRAMLNGADAHPDASIFAVQMLQLRHPTLVDNRGLYFAFTGHHRQIDSGRPRTPERPTGPVYGASGGAMGVRRNFLARHGLFDESFGTYLEDAEFAHRAHRAGAECIYLSEAFVYHHGSATAGTMPEWKFFQIQRNQAVLRARTRVGRVGLIAPQTAYVGVRILTALRDRRLFSMLRAIREARTVTPNIGGFVPAEP